MEWFKLLTIFLPLIFAISASEDPQAYCGSHLIQALKSVCNSRYYGRAKRSFFLDNYIDGLDDMYPSERYDYNALADLLFDNEISTHDLLNGNFHKRHLIVRDIVNECCKKPCSRETLSLYCSTSPN
ncbi:hypothetical protein AMK59_7564 [Oryctes borbonicus]|uniref:Insulin-like domain-containing protein n=1 Tax=Oryctes borbonicus TaxID=1629725 RepID=A0A0T6AW25_9SCAR|nr:hypothetical protein AMK59_7564 [Oryctes borbonicus]